jgi:acyl-CoA synthetase (AMP-forming)/AMP-acid ligase II
LRGKPHADLHRQVEGCLDASKRPKIASEITRIHSETTGAPTYFAQVIFTEMFNNRRVQLAILAARHFDRNRREFITVLGCAPGWPLAARAQQPAIAPVAMDADAVMRMAFTSGTTGNPKGVMHSHNTTLAAARILNGDLGLAADDVMMIWLPLGLNWGYLTLVQSVLAGAKAVLLDRFRPAAALDLIERERVTYIPTAPASLTSVLQEPDLARRDLSRLRIVVSGGASAPVETIRAWRRGAPGVLLEPLGMLETGYQAYTRAHR